MREYNLGQVVEIGAVSIGASSLEPTRHAISMANCMLMTTAFVGAAIR